MVALALGAVALSSWFAAFFYAIMRFIYVSSK
jgi:hypothetical protein